MHDGKFSFGFRVAFALFAITLFVTTTWAATEKKLHNLGLTNSDGRYAKLGALMFDSAGNLYGVTREGGNNICPDGCGTAVELSPDGQGGWIEKVLHYFGNGTDGVYPEGPLTPDSAGNLYGTTSAGGDYNLGTVFELSPTGNGDYTEKKLHNFGSDADGAAPYSGVVFDSAGDLYGTTGQGGNYSYGTVFEMTPNGDGSWAEKKLHSFGNGTDGNTPYAGVVLDGAGNLYGTTWGGGAAVCSCGTVYEVSPNGDGTWTEKKLHSFGMNNTDGAFPYAGLIFDAGGNLYGTTTSGGNYGCNASGCGTVFRNVS